MNYILSACALLLITMQQSAAVSLVFDGTTTLESGNKCETGAVYRLGTSTSYKDKGLDVLVEFLDSQNLSSSACLSHTGNYLSFVFGSYPVEQIFTDIQITIVEKDTNTPVEVNSLTAVIMDLDQAFSDEIDYLYINKPTSVILGETSNVTYNDSISFTSTAGTSYTSRLDGPAEKCPLWDPSSTPNCMATVTWGGKSEENKGVSTINLHYDNAGDVLTVFYLSFNLDEVASIALGDDYSDAPISYGEAFHTITPKLSLGMGSIADSETVAAYSSNADGDDVDADKPSDYDEEDGVTSFNQLADGYTDYDVNVIATNNTDTDAKLIGWIDFNGNGFFESSEASITTIPAATDGEIFPMQWAINTNIPEGTIYSRFRISTDTALDASTATGYMSDGEVEDFNLTAMAAEPFACNSDSYVFTSDAIDSPTFATILDLANGSAKSANEGLSFYPTNINATGYNLKDGYIWGYDMGNNKVVRVGNDFKVETYTIPGLPLQNYHIGDVSPQGIYYMATMDFGGTEIHMVDINPQSPGYKTYLGKIDLPKVNSSLLSFLFTTLFPGISDFGVIATEYVADFALHPFDNHLYFIGWRDQNKGILYKVDVTTSSVTEVGNIGVPLSINPNTTWFDNQGYLYSNHADDVYRIDLTDPNNPQPKAELFSSFSIPDYGDAARCSRAPITEHDYDFGDAPDSYGTDNTPANSPTGADGVGAMHIINPNIYLGSEAPDAEADGQASADASGDDSKATDDEDAVASFPTLYASATSYTIPAADITVHNVTGNTAVLYAYIDFNGDGDFTDPGEGTSTTVKDGATQPVGDLTWTNLSGLVEGDTFIRLRFTTDTILTANGGANDGEVEDYMLTISTAPGCTDFSGDTNGGISPLMQLVAGEKFFIASTTQSPVEGHLKAYSLDSSGQPDEYLWDAATEMTKAERSAALYSTDADGAKTLFSSLDDAAFVSNGLPEPVTIRNFTLDPSFGEGSIYLGDRQSGSFLGGISPNSTIALLSNDMDTISYLSDETYRTFFTNTVSQRSDEGSASIPKLVILSSDDGFVYAFDQYDGNLNWGWMPRSLAAELKDPTSFYLNHFMEGRLDLLDLKKDSSYDSYLAGSYRSGLGQFVLKLASDSSLDSVVWDIDHKASNSIVDNSPNYGERAYFSDDSGNVYSAYIVTNISAESYLHIRSLIDNSVQMEILLDFTATSTPYIMPTFGNLSAPAGKTVYVGGNDGKIYSAALLDDSGNLNTTATIRTAINGTAAVDLGVTEDVKFMGASVSGTDNKFYLRTQTSQRLTLFKYDASNSSWVQQWTAFAGGAKRRDGNGNMIDDTTNIDALPSNAIISDAAFIVSNSIVLPVSIPPAANSTYCYGEAYYYFYKISDGYFPENTFYNTGNARPISGPALIGYGNAKRLLLSHQTGADKLMGMGISEQKTNNAVGINRTFIIKDPVTIGIRSWRELRN